MAQVIKCEIGGVDYGILGPTPALIGLSLEPAGDSDIGVARITLGSTSYFLSAIKDKHEVHIYVWDTVAAAIVVKLFWGFVSIRETTSVYTHAGTAYKTWTITCQDINLALDSVMKFTTTSLAVAAGAFNTQVAGVVSAWQHDTTGTPSLTIDTSGVPNLYSSVSAQTLTIDMSLRQALNAIMAATDASSTGTIQPRYYLGPSSSLASWGNVTLYAYNVAATPTVARTYAYAPAAGQYSVVSLSRVLDGSGKVEERSMNWGANHYHNNGVSDGGKTARNPFVGDGYWQASALSDSTSPDSVTANAVYRSRMLRTSRNRETIKLVTYTPSAMGDYVAVIWPPEGLTGSTNGAVYRVVGLAVNFDDAGIVTTYELTLGVRVLVFGESDDSTVPSIPIE